MKIVGTGERQCGGSVYKFCQGGQWTVQEGCPAACDATCPQGCGVVVYGYSGLDLKQTVIQ